MNEYEIYEKECAQIRAGNAKLLAEFAAFLTAQNLAPKTVEKHCSNIEFYINDYLLYEDPTQPEQGVSSISMFLGYWFIKKATWSSPSAIKENAASLKKFYAWMLTLGKIEEESFTEMKMEIKERMPEWIETMKRYDDPELDDMAEVWGD